MSLPAAVYPDGRVCISILHAPGDDPMGYESSAERWSPVQSVEKILLSVVSMLAGGSPVHVILFLHKSSLFFVLNVLCALGKVDIFLRMFCMFVALLLQAVMFNLFFSLTSRTQ